MSDILKETKFNLTIIMTDDKGVLHSEEWYDISHYKVRSIVDEWMDETVVSISVIRIV